MAADLQRRAASDVEAIFQKGEEGMQDADGFIRQMAIGKTYTQGTDRAGRPVMFVAFMGTGERTTEPQNIAATSTSQSTVPSTSLPRLSRTTSSVRWSAFAASSVALASRRSRWYST